MSGGYDVIGGYVRGLRPEMTPAALRAVQVLRGRAPMDLSGGFRFLDLGCGQGFQVLATAAAHPEARCTGVDFSPDHIVEGRALAAAADLENAVLEEAGFDALAADPAWIGPADIAIAHGVWTWVDAGTRAALTAVFRSHVATGGLVCLGYNAMPGWGEAAALRRLVQSLAEGRRGRGPGAAVDEAFGWLKLLGEAECGAMAKGAPLAGWVGALSKAPSGYVRHELLPSAGGAAWHEDVARALAPAQLGYVGSARLIDNLDQVWLPDPVLERLAEADALGAGETLRDIAVNRSFRFDVFGRGSLRVGAAAAGAALEALPVALSAAEREPGPLARTPRGALEIDAEAEAAVRAALLAGPCRLGEAADRAAAAGLPRQAAGQALTLLLAAGRLLPLTTLTPAPEAVAACRRLNAAVLAEDPKAGSLASPLCGGVELSPAVRAALAGEPAPAGAEGAHAAEEVAAARALLPEGTLPAAG